MPPSLTQKLGVCLRCREKKADCQFSPGKRACRQCVASGNEKECVPQENPTRPAGAPPSDLGLGEVTEPRTGQKRGSRDSQSQSLAVDGSHIPGQSRQVKRQGQSLTSQKHGPGESGAQTSLRSLPTPLAAGPPSPMLEDDGSKYHSDPPIQDSAMHYEGFNFLELNPYSGSRFYDIERPSAIQCAVRRNGTDIPFQILPSISLDSLRTTVAEKLDLSPQHVILRYRLDYSNTKHGAIIIGLIRIDNELANFKSQWRSVTSPRHLGNTDGKPKNGPEKIIVYFEDASTDNGGPRAVGSSGNTKRQKGKSAKSKGSGSTIPGGRLDGTGRREELIEKLQERWACERHGSEKPMSCWSPAGVPLCYALTHDKIALWANEIMKGRATVDDKPPSITFQDERPRIRSTTANQVPAGAPNEMGDSELPGPEGHPSTSEPHLQVRGAPMYHGTGTTSNNNTQPPSLPSVHVSDIPDIITWFKYLDRHDQCNKDGILFAPFGEVLRAMGFIRLSQLTSPFVQRSDLQAWLRIKVGTAILIMQYAAHDLDAINSGWVFPRDS